MAQRRKERKRGRVWWMRAGKLFSKPWSKRMRLLSRGGCIRLSAPERPAASSDSQVAVVGGRAMGARWQEFPVDEGLRVARHASVGSGSGPDDEGKG